MTKRPCYFDTLAEVIDSAIAAFEDRGVTLDFGSEAANELWPQHLRNAACDAGHLGYGSDRRHDFPIASLKGQRTRKYAHINIWRSTEGRYELNTYIL